MIRFEHPWLLLVLLALPALVAWRLRHAETAPAAVRWGALRGLPGAGPLRRLLLLVVRLLPWAAMAVAVVAIARPQQGMQQSEVDSRGVDIVLAIDVSRSMQASDMGGGTRLDLARRTARDFVRGRPHDRVGIVGFAGTAFTQCPLTLDHETLSELVGTLDFGLAEDGTAIGMGLATAVQRLRESRTPSKVVVLLTDGENNRGAIDPATAAEIAHAMGIKVYTVLVGRPTMEQVQVNDPVLGPTYAMMQVDVDPAPLIEIANRTGGRFFRAGDAATLGGIYAEIDRLERAPVHATVYREYRDLGPMLLALASALFALGAFSSATWAFRAP
jgi:Ca-activated chloride channel family protein